MTPTPLSQQAQAELAAQLDKGFRTLHAFNQELEPDMHAWKQALHAQGQLLDRMRHLGLVL